MGRFAIIDLGTNTFHLMIVESPSHRILLRERQAVKIGMGGINNNTITDDAKQRALSALASFKKLIEQHGVTEVHAIATSAFRNAYSRKEVIEAIKTQTGISVRVISGDEEATYIYLGVRSAVALETKPVLIVDIGGGSVEFIIGNSREIFWKQSIEIGAQRLLEEFQHHDPITEQEISNLNTHFDRTLSALFTGLHKFNPITLVGASGTFDTLSDIYCLKNGISTEPGQPETPLSLEAFKDIYKSLVSKNRSERLAIPGMIEMRVDMIVVACCLIDYIVSRFHFTKIRVSGYSLKEGVLEQIARAPSR